MTAAERVQGAPAGLLRWHGRVGLVACAGVLMWALSGILHPVMSRQQPRPATAVPPAQVLDLRDARPLASVLREHGIARMDSFRVVTMPGGRYYQVALPGLAGPVYFELVSGRRAADADRTYAEYLARHYLGDLKSAIAEIHRVDSFDDEYTYINRLLPAYRVAFVRDDGMRVYVDTATSALGTLVDQHKSWLSAYFRALHTWAFLDRMPWLKSAIMLVLLSAALLTAVLGIRLYALRRKAQTSGVRRAHRTVAMLVSVSTLTFAFSGGWHLLQGLTPPVAAPGLRVEGYDAGEFKLALPAALSHLPSRSTIRSVGAARIDGRAHYRVETAPPAFAHNAAHHESPLPGGGAAAMPPALIDSASGAVVPDGETRYARALATAFSGLTPDAIRDTASISRFGGEYGFVFKRLPVWRVEFEAPGRPRYYVHAASATLAARIDDGDAREGWSFAYLHKFEWLAPLGTLVRDGVAMAFALGNALVALAGLVLFSRRLRKEKFPALVSHR